MKAILFRFAQHRRLCAALLFLVLVLLAFGVRTYHYNNAVHDLGLLIGDVPREELVQPSFFGKFFPHYHKNFAPFTIESGMMFSYAQAIAEGKGVPKSDPLLAGQTDWAPYEQMIMGLEWFLGWGWRVKNAIVPDRAPEAGELRFQDHPAMAQWMSMQIRLWASLTSGLIFLWLLVMRCPWRLAFAAGLLHAFSLAAVARATGQDLVRGEFCMPFLMATLVLLTACCTAPRRWKYALLFAAAFCTMSFWDLSLMLFSALCVYELLRYLLSGKASPARRNAWIVLYAAIVLSAVLIPFNRAYSVGMSPLIVVLLPALMLVLIAGAGKVRPVRQRLVLALAVPLLLYGFWMVAVDNPRYDSNYSHFSELMKAKIKFMNVKPADPEKLTYDARIMWTPSMHSADSLITVSFFPSLYFGLASHSKPIRFLFGLVPVTLTFFYLLLIAGAVLTLPRKALARGLPCSLMPILFTIGFTVGFIFMVRYHEFLILFLCPALALTVRDYLRVFRLRDARPGDAPYLKLLSGARLVKTVRISLYTMLCFCVMLEIFASLFAVRRRYTGDVQLRETARLIEWFRTSPKTRGKIVLANITLGPILKAYCGTGVALNPQFGLERLRRPVEIYLMSMYHGTEEKLAEFCDSLGVDYLIYNKGSMHSMHIYSTRYIAAAKEIDGRAPVNLFYHHYNQRKLNRFYRIEPPRAMNAVNNAFSVFRVIRPEDKVKALQMMTLGEEALDDGNRKLAGQCAAAAVVTDPSSFQNRYFFYKVFQRDPVLTLDGIQ